jgi:hypothetical protein
VSTKQKRGCVAGRYTVDVGDGSEAPSVRSIRGACADIKDAFRRWEKAKGLKRVGWNGSFKVGRGEKPNSPLYGRGKKG